jgi:hypothetical protein
MAYEWISKDKQDNFKRTDQIFRITADFDFGWWFAYFWKEARAAGGRNDPGDNKLKAMMVQIFGDPTVGAVGFAAQRNAARDWFTDELGGARWPATDDLKRAVLQLALEMGFTAMPPTGADGGVQRGQELRRYFKNRMRIRLAGGGRMVMPIGCRGDGRDFATVKAHGGALNRVDLGLNNMGQPWHPLSRDPHKSQLFFRIASGDNCLYSVLSVADSLKLGIGFPLIEDRQIYTFPSGYIMHWSRGDFSAAATGKVSLARTTCVVNGKLSTGIFLGTETYAYAFKVLGDAVHTQDFLENEMGGAKDQCIERGVRDVALQDFLFGIRIRRIHLGPTRGHGITAFIVEVKYQMGGEWYADVSTADFAASHFHDDSQAAEAVLAAARAAAAAGSLVQSLDGWGLSYEDFQAIMREPRNKHHDNHIYFGGTT